MHEIFEDSYINPNIYIITSFKKHTSLVMYTALVAKNSDTKKHKNNIKEGHLDSPTIISLNFALIDNFS